MKKQVLFSPKENAKAKGFSKDPVGDKNAEIKTGVLQKYKGRLLILASDKCAVNCRFCFRRNFTRNKTNGLVNYLKEQMCNILKKDKSIKEVILSGGDPLMLADGELKTIFNAVPKHIYVRIHSRIPIAMPNRFTPALNALLKRLGTRLIFVCHVNHPNELDGESEKIFRRLAKYGATLLNQSVLLKGVNDSADVLAALSEKLFAQGVLPYYLHQLDRAQGAAHFEVPIKNAKTIFSRLKELLPGYLVPRLVKETKGGKSKKWIASA